MIQARNRFTRREGWDLINKAVPQRYRFTGNTDQRLTRASIKPWVPTGKNPPINDATQQSRIDNYLRQWPTDLKSLLLYGTYNTSKTTFAAAYVTDVITDRVAYTPEPESAGFFQEESFDACVWSINLNEWFDSYLNWRTRDHDDHEVRKPSITAAEINETSERMQLSPVLWIEELDKVNFTDTNRNWLHTLVDRVYQMNGCVIATTNKSLRDLEKSIGEGILGRLDGSRDGGEGYVTVNFSTPKKTPPVS